MNHNKFLNPNAFYEFKFRKWKMALFVRSGMWLDDYEKMNWCQKIVFNIFGHIPKNFRPKFEIWLDETNLKELN